MSVQIVTDSAADLPKEIIEKYSIKVIPLVVMDGDQEYLDGETLDPVDLFAGMRKATVYKTSQPKFQTYLDVFKGYAEERKTVLYIAFSSGLSGTYQTAVMAKNELVDEYPDFSIEVVDTKCASFGEGLVVLYAAQMAETGASLNELKDKVVHWAEHMEHIFTVDDLNTLMRGGRVSPLSAFIGGLLNIKPILDVEDGKLIPIEKVRGRKKVFQRIIEIMRERGVQLDKQVIGISHGDDLEAAQLFADMIRESFGTKEIITTIIGGAVGAHAGPGTLAIFFQNVE
ncbi:DegV family protein [Gorillibacterium massiliense]|uniref:DegV family protein n=1 Tax=Gorillibacterium massiliense TaxID=1280390 RepID=UPI0004B508A9|nr:DegV family protein [Gorillibacterium massiliense]